MENEIDTTKSVSTDNYTLVVKKKRVRKVGTKPKRKKKGVIAFFNRFLHNLADASDADAYEKEYVTKYSKKKKDQG